MINTRLGQFGVGLARYLGFIAKPPAARTPLVPNEERTIIVEARKFSLVTPGRQFNIVIRPRRRHFIAEKNMIHQADSKRPGLGDAPIFSLNIRKELAVSGETITGVAASVEVKQGQTDPDVGSMLQGAATYTGTTISAQVGGGISGNSYYLKFNVTTNLQPLEFVMSIPVDDEGAFATP